MSQNNYAEMIASIVSEAKDTLADWAFEKMLNEIQRVIDNARN